jgi:hypothetical protein
MTFCFLSAARRSEKRSGSKGDVKLALERIA